MGIVAADLEQMAQAHRLAVQAIKSTNGDIRAGWTLALVDLQAAEGGEERWFEARRLGQTDWLDVSADDDFVGVQTYSRTRIGADGQLPVPEGAATMQTGWEVYPEALGHTVRLAAEHAGVPVLVTENGMATDDDAARVAYTRAALEGLAHAQWRTGSTCAATSTGRCSTISSGTPASPRRSASSPSTARPSSGPVKPSARWLGQVARRNGLG